MLSNNREAEESQIIDRKIVKSNFTEINDSKEFKRHQAMHLLKQVLVKTVSLSYVKCIVDASTLNSDEGRGQLRYASASCEQALTRGFPNGETLYE